MTGMEAREQRGIELAERMRIKQDGERWIVPSASGDGRYAVSLAEQRCTCVSGNQGPLFP